MTEMGGVIDDRRRAMLDVIVVTDEDRSRLSAVPVFFVRSAIKHH